MAGGSAAERVGRAPETREFLFKVLVVGELGVGKSSVVQRYVYQLFSEDYRATIGVDFALKEIAWDLHTRVRLQFWDVAENQKFVEKVIRRQRLLTKHFLLLNGTLVTH